MEKAKRIKPSYSPKDIQSVINKDTWHTHFEKLYAKYVREYNGGAHDEFTHGGYVLHALYFEQLRAKKSANKPTGPAMIMIQEKFGDLNEFKKQFAEKAKELKGSGWIYLSTNGSINIIEKHRPVKDVALIIDLWEHAYVESYGTNREAYMRNMWSIIDWDVVSQRIGSFSEPDKMRAYIKMINS